MKEISEEEIEAAVWSLHPNKAPGPDGFTITFYRQHWQTIKKDLSRMVRNVFKNKKMGGNTKSSYLELIPKDANPSTFNRFRPISLCNSSYKIVTKIIVNRIKKVLPEIISENQGGFVPNRLIIDNVMVVQEAIHSSMKRKEKGIIIKLDMANAFDRVSLPYLRAILNKFSFSKEIIEVIKACITDPWITPLINGIPIEFFQSSRGLRQGCPLFPFLYIIMTDTLSRTLDTKRQERTLTGLQISKGIKSINHSLFADDTLLLGGSSCIIAKRLKKIIDNFLEVSGSLLNNA